jgi:hypothetical protein
MCVNLNGLISFRGYCILQAIMTIGQGGKSLRYSNAHMKIFPPVVVAGQIYSTKSEPNLKNLE